jgi:hypothetical protein
MLTNTHPRQAAALADLAASLGLIHPRLALVHAHTAEATGDRQRALDLLDATLTVRNANTDPAWRDLLAACDAIAARQAAAARIPDQPPRYRLGHTAPATRPDRRCFQLTSNPDGPAEPPTPKPRARARRAKHAGR